MREKKTINTIYVKSKTELAKIRAANLQGVRTDNIVMGSGPMNRDGVPKLPPDQRQVKNWPVLDLGVHPEVAISDWRLTLLGHVSRPCEIDIKILKTLPIIEDTSDFHCVTGWSQFDLKWKGVRFSEIAKYVDVKSDAKYVYITASDGYSTNLSLEEAMKYDVLIAFEVDGQPLPEEHGGPVRMITPQLWAWKGAKWICGIEFLKENRRGFWEQKGYSNSAVPWLNDRYTADEVD